jgi:hypothetical protein
MDKKEENKITLLWFSILWRYFIYTAVFQGVVSYLLTLVHMASLHEMYLQNKSMMVVVYGAWHGIGSFIALKQALRAHQWHSPSKEDPLDN